MNSKVFSREQINLFNTMLNHYATENNLIGTLEMAEKISDHPEHYASLLATARSTKYKLEKNIMYFLESDGEMLWSDLFT